MLKRYNNAERKIFSVPQPKGMPDRTGTIQCIFLLHVKDSLGMLVSYYVSAELANQNKLLGSIILPINAETIFCSRLWGRPFAALFDMRCANTAKLITARMNPTSILRKVSPISSSLKP
jgi:hypothetical protein